MLVVISPAFLERSHPDSPMLASRLRNPKPYPINILAHKTFTTVESTDIGRSGWRRMINRHEATTAISKLQAAIADAETIQLTDFFGEVKTTIVISIVAEIPPKKALTNDNCSATAVT
jgi:hypothetical protein